MFKSWRWTWFNSLDGDTVSREMKVVFVFAFFKYFIYPSNAHVYCKYNLIYLIWVILITNI
jgi:hypothetical protein